MRLSQVSSQEELKSEYGIDSDKIDMEGDYPVTDAQQLAVDLPYINDAMIGNAPAAIAKHKEEVFRSLQPQIDASMAHC